MFNPQSICSVAEMNEKSFYIFLDYFGQAIVGHKFFNEDVKRDVIFSSTCTVSDEAYGRFTLERCWDSWLSTCNKKNNPNAFIVKPKHTVLKSNKKFGGWDQEGLKRYSDIAKLVSANRKTHKRKEMEENYKESKCNQYRKQNNTPVQNASNLPTKPYVAYNDLCGEIEEECEDKKVLENDQDENFDSDNGVEESEENGHYQEEEYGDNDSLQGNNNSALF